MKRFKFFFITIFAIFAIVSCREYKETEVSEIKIISGDNQCLPPNTEGKDVFCEFLGPSRVGIFGGKGERSPVPAVKVSFETLDNSDIQIMNCSEKSDDGGKIKFRFKTGRKLGDNYVKVIPEGFESASKIIRIVNGVSISGANQEAFAESYLEEALKVKVFNSDGSPAEGVKVYFSFISFPGSKNTAKCKSLVVTDKDGVAENQVRVGKEAGKYKLLVEVCRESIISESENRGIELTFYGKNFFGITGVIITVLGGLAIFIYGMTCMTSGLQLVAGEQMKRILRFFTRNSVFAVLAGTLVTGIIQSSSACTVMVVGFVNAGLLTLKQAIGVVFGANIGTTVTAQLISFKIGDTAYIFAIFGLLIFMIAKKTRAKGWGQSFIGFGLLFLGLEIMSEELKSISDFPSIINTFRYFDCTPHEGFISPPITAVLGAIMVGTIMTVIIQSSSATIGIALVLASNNLINFYTAVPLILGDNIGTTITANLAAINANRRAKQAAFAHFIFNFIGVLYMSCLFYLPWDSKPIFLSFIDYITPGDVFAPEPVNITRHIAMAHTMFNVVNVIILFPFIPLVERISCFVIPIRDMSSVKVKHLEPHLLDTPPVAIEQVIDSIRYMTSEAWKMSNDVMQKVVKTTKFDESIIDEINTREMKIDEMQKDITSYLVELTSRRLTESQAEIIPLLIHCTNDAERIGDHACNLMKFAEALHKNEQKIPNSIQGEIDYLWSILNNQAKHVLDCLQNTKKEDYVMALKDEDKINTLVKNIEKKNIKQMKKGKTDAIVGTSVLEILTSIEKIGDHLTNIAERIPDIQKEHIRLF
ncbi:MAG TPA: Na/Pi cotransporter family protein [Victivallales bacterium]|nr:Na/Pi cotransporter family protein [Victivallales bacterium]